MDGQAAFHLANVFPQNRRGSADGAVDYMIGWIAGQNLRDPLVDVEPLTSRTCGHVGVGQRVGDWTVFQRPRIKVSRHAANLGLDPCSRVMGNQGGESSREAAGLDVPGAINGMETGVGEFWCAADVVEFP